MYLVPTVDQCCSDYGGVCEVSLICMSGYLQSKIEISVLEGEGKTRRQFMEERIRLQANNIEQAKYLLRS